MNKINSMIIDFQSISVFLIESLSIGLNPDLCTQRAGKTKERSSTPPPTSLVGGKFSKAREPTYKACLQWPQEEYIFAPTHQNLRGLTQIQSRVLPDGLNNNLLS